MTNDLAVRRDAIVTMLVNQADQLETILPKGVTKQAFIRLAKNAIIRDPKIAEADTQSVFLEVCKAAQDGLVLDGREAVLTRFNTKKGNDWVVQVAYIPMIAGIKKRVMNSKMIKSWSIGLVYENEMKIDPETGRSRFQYFAGDDPRIHHEPIIIGDRGSIVAAYSSAKLSDGSFHHEVMTIKQLHAIKARTKSKKQDGTITGPWATDEEEMFRKTVARRHSKSLPMSAEDMEVMTRADVLYDVGDRETVYDTPVEPEPSSVAAKRAGSAKDKLKAAAGTKTQARPVEPTGDDAGEQEPHTIDGEVIERDGGDDADDEF